MLLLDRDWDLDFKAMVDAHRMVMDGRLKMDDPNGVALVYYQKQWLVWNINAETAMPATNPEGDAVLQRFKERLTTLGQEDVFFRWIEIVQYETSQQGGFSEARKASATQELKKLLSDPGVDYSSVLDEIGGLKGLPGFEQSSR